jgi:hypothetical protein
MHIIAAQQALFSASLCDESAAMFVSCESHQKLTVLVV